MHPVRNLWDLRALRDAASAYAVVAAWESSGLFAALADGRARDIAELPADARAIRATIPILLGLGLLCGDGTHWALTRVGLELWERGDLQLPFAQRDLRDFARLGDVMLHGGPVDSLPATSTSSNPDMSSFQDMLHRRSATEALELVRWLKPQLPAGGRVLDLGGGHGRFSATLAEAGFEVTLFDQPEVIALTRERYDGDRFALVGGDFFESDLQGPYDGVLLSDIVHNFDEASILALLARVVAALRPGGVLALRDQFLEDDACAPERAAYFGVVMLLYTRGGRSYTHTEVLGWLRERELACVQHVRLTDTDSSLFIARRRSGAREE